MEGLTLPVPTQVPDFVRTLEIDDIEVLLDAIEIKVLDTPEDWSTEEARQKANKAIEPCLFQVYKIAMTALIHNPTWERAYVTLIIGVYFSQFFWKRPEKFEVKPPLHFDYFANLPHTRLSLSELVVLDAHVRYAIKECESRPMPEILCWNQPMFQFGGENPNRPGTQSIVLSPQLRWSMRQPLQHYGRSRYQFSWLSAPQNRPKEITDAVNVRGFLVYAHR